MRPRDVKYHVCPRCGKPAVVLVALGSDTRFCRDAAGNLQYQCISCLTTFSVDRIGRAIRIMTKF